ncbi:MAG: permease prefix domain 1-containing protein [Kineosporiaceae bacterium]
MTIPDTTAATLRVHRLLDDAFAGIAMTEERRDLKEELRCDLVARVGELIADGMDAEEAARRALAGLGDVRALVEAAVPGPATASPDQRDQAPGANTPHGLGAATPHGAGSAGTTRAWIDAGAVHRVRPRPAYVVRAVLLAAVTAGGLAGVALAAATDAGRAPRLTLALVTALALGAWITDALQQETTTTHPMPALRATGYGAGVGAVLAAAGLAWQYWPGQEVTWLALAVAPLLAGAALLAGLAAGQTNRHKAWVLQLSAAQPVPSDRFTEHPEVAARFGIYSAITLVVTVVAFVALTATVGWAWSWTAIVGGLAVILTMLARMLFGGDEG